MITILTHIYRVRAILALLLFLSSASLWAQSDDATLTNITNLEQLHAIRYDLNGNGVVSFTTAASLTGSPMFSDRTAVVALMGADSIYAQAFTSGDFYTTEDGTSPATGAVAVSTTYYYKLSSAATSPYTGYELMNSLDFEDADGDGTADDKSIWAEGATAAGVPDAVAGGWAPLGGRFTATFEGNNYTISSLYINRLSTDNVGLFRTLGTGGNLRNLGIEGGSLSGRNRVGGLAGENNGGTITACHAIVNVTASKNDVGGLVGVNEGGAIANSYATGTVRGSGLTVGGLAGVNKKKGATNATIRASYAVGNVTAAGSGSNVSAGGLVGINAEDCTIGVSYATGNVTGGSGSNPRTGSLAGRNEGTIRACYVLGSVTGGSGSDARTGGLVGDNTLGGTIRVSYAAVSVTAGSGANPRTGGLAGENAVSSSISDSYFDTDYSGQTDAIGRNDGTATNVEGKTTTELQTPTAYGTAMDIYANWNIDIDNADTDDDPATGTDDPWDFGTSSQYPALKVDFDVDGTATADEFGSQRTTHFLSMQYMFSVVLGISAGSEVGTVVAVPADFNNTLSYSILSQTLNGAAVSHFVIANTAIGTISVADPAPTEAGLYTLSVEVSDGAGGTATTEVIINLYLPLLMSGGEVTTCSDKFTDTGGESGDYGHHEDITMTISPESAADRVLVEFTSFHVEGNCAYDRLEVYDGATTSAPLIGTYCGTNSPGVVLSNRAGGKLTFRFKSDGSDTFFGWEATISCVPAPVVPAAPTALTATAGNALVVLRWTPPSDNGGAQITGYMLQYDTDMNFSSPPTTVSITRATTSYAVSGLTNATPYYFRVAAVNSAGTGASGTAVSATPDASIVVDYDSDDDGLIDITTLEQLDAIRYDLDGNGAVATADEAAYAVAFPSEVATYAAISCGDGTAITTCSGYELRSDLDFAGTKWEDPDGGTFTGTHETGGWAPIGTNSNRFTATFEGNNHTISNLYIDRSSTDNVGLFGYLGINDNGTSSDTSDDQVGEIRNLEIEGGSVTGDDHVGGLVGYSSSGTISDCSSSGSVAGEDYVGGLVGFSFSGTISGSSSSASVTGDSPVGGLAGYNAGTISGSSSSGSVTGDDRVGGLVGWNSDGTISGSSSSGSVTGEDYVGGLVGDSSNGTISGSSSSGSVTGDSPVGGLVGNFSGSRSGIVVSDCYATGDVIAEGNNSQAGGLVGRTGWAIVLNCYATGDVTLIGDNGVAGGLVGSHVALLRNGYARGNVEIRGNNGIAGGLVGHSDRAKIRTSYATGNVLVVGGDGTAGGLVGYNRGEREVATISACYSTGQAIASENAGGLIGAIKGGWLRACYSTGSVFGENIGGLIGSGDGFVEYSYFDHEASNRPKTDAYAKSSDELHSVGSYTGIYENWAFDIDCDHSSDDIWNFVGDDKYPKLKLDFNGDLSATASEFGEQLLVFVDADGREMLSPVLSASSGATGTVGTLRGINAENDNAAKLALEGMSDVFELASNGELSVQSGKAVSHLDAPYTVLVRLTEGTRSVVRSVSVQVAALNDNDGDGLIDVTTLEQLHAIGFDLNGDGQVDSGVTEADSIAYEGAFGLSRKGSIHCLASCKGYELMNNLDFEDANGDGTADDKSIWAEGASGAGVSGAVAEGWAPIGDNSTDSDESRFTAIFEGNDHTISNLYINRSGTSYVGLFGALGLGSNVRNLGIEGGRLSGDGNVGGLVGYSEGTISACYATGTATGTGDLVGGLVGNNPGTISACYATGAASGSSGVGGLVGRNAGTISACYATGDATGTGGSVGGLVGRNAGTISACYATGDATGGGSVGGLVGRNDNSGTISACYATGDASGTNWVGGLVGRSNGGTISACYATGDASGSSNVGGLVGSSSGTVTNSYFDSTVSNRTDSDDYAKTTAQLQTPTVYDDNADATDGSSIYEAWNIDVDDGQPIGVDDGTMPGDAAVDDPWDFGTDSEYPALRADFNVSGTPTAFEFGGQGRAAAVPDAPSALTATAANTAVTLNWDAPSENGGAEITGYMIEHDTDMNFPSPTPVTTADDATSHTVSSLTNATPYYFRVAAVNSVGTGAYYPGATDAAVTATPAPEAPAAPSALTAMAGNAEVTLNWTAAASDGGATITGYMVEYDTDMNFPSPTPATTMAAATSHTVSGLANGTPYYFRVAAVNAVGASAYYPGMGDAAVSATPATVPAAPSALTAMAGNAEVTLNWTAAASDGGATITGYMVEYDTDMNFSSSPTPATTAAAATSHTVSGLTNGTPYYFRVAAVNSVGTSAYYPGASGTAVSATPATVPAAPSALTATAADAAVTLNWTAAASDGGATITGYMVEYDTDMNFPSPTPATTAAAATSHTVSGLTNGTLYYFRVAAVNAVGTGAYYPGATDAAVSAAPTPPPPVVLSFTPEMGVVGATVMITGTGFSTTVTDNAVTFLGAEGNDADNAEATVSTSPAPTATSLSVSVPPAAQTGKISVMVGTAADTSAASFTVTATTPAPDPPVVSSFTPTSGALGATVTITGTGFSTTATENTVTFLGAEANDADNAAATVSISPAPTATSLSVSVPSTAQTGKISVMVGTAADTSAASFTVTATTPAPAAPVVSSFSPTEGEVDTEVTITGVNFSDMSSENEVRFGGVMAEDPTSASTTSLVVLVPSGAVTGSISVAVGGQTGTSSEIFTVTVPAPAPAAPVVSSFSPTEGEVDTEVTITGVNFSATPSANEVRFGGVMAAAPTSASTTSLVVLVPSGAVTGRISVAVGGQTGTSSENFTVTAPAPAPAAPVVSSFSPTEGEVDTEVTITGVNFSDMSSENEVRFGGVMAAAPTSASTTSLAVLVPSGAVTGRVSVAVGGQTGTSSTDFTVTGTTPAPEPPVVSSFTPTEGEVGTSVTITGENFSDMPSENEVKFGGVMAAAPTSASTTSLTVLVPSGARTGSISVAVGGQTGTSSESFTVTAPAPAPEPPVVSSFTPSEGVVGTSVTITGDNFSATPSENEVRFGGVMAAEPTSASTTSLTILVPSGARTGSISVAVGGQTGTSSENFTVTAPAPAPDPPVVSSFTPTSGPVGTTVTITGENFSDMPSENEVGFGGVMAEDPTSASTTSLTVRVPSGARTGRVSVAVGGQTGTSSEDFTVTGTTPVSPFSVPLSSERDVRVYPNPTSGQLHFKGLLAGGRYVCDLYSLVAQKVLSSVVRAGDTMDTSTLSSGQYILILQAEGRELMRTRLLVVR